MASTRRSARTKAQQREQTIRTLVGEARRLFATRGYAHVSLADIVQAAGVTKGALYHHFTGKEDIFRAVLAQVHQEVGERIAATAPEADGWTQLVSGCRTFLTVSTQAHIQQIMLIDAPAVLGWGAWRELDAATSMQHLQDAVESLIEEKVIPEQPVRPVVHLLSGAMNEAALWLARSEDRERDLAHTMVALERMLESLRHGW